MDTTTATAEPKVTEQAKASAVTEADYWYALIDEEPAADFLNLKPRTLQAKRATGGGPKFIRLSSRCVKYRRCDLREWTEACIRVSTSDTGQAA